MHIGETRKRGQFSAEMTFRLQESELLATSHSLSLCVNEALFSDEGYNGFIFSRIVWSSHNGRNVCIYTVHTMWEMYTFYDATDNLYVLYI